MSWQSGPPFAPGCAACKSGMRQAHAMLKCGPEGQYGAMLLQRAALAPWGEGPDVLHACTSGRGQVMVMEARPCKAKKCTLKAVQWRWRSTPDVDAGVARVGDTLRGDTLIAPAASGSNHVAFSKSVLCKLSFMRSRCTARALLYGLLLNCKLPVMGHRPRAVKVDGQCSSI
jgi:hypothetical protein